MKRNLCLTAAAVLVLAACGADQPQTRRLDLGQAAQGYPAETFRCENGATVRVSPAGEDHVRLSLGNAHTRLAAQRAASGNLYTAQQGLFGKPTEWHVKGGEAAFEYTSAAGAAVVTVCRSAD
ncbi:MliC family protein [Neisseria leonii]|uniref:MliC family protein n=1 Tax=Neisseria leonii TaxID=2995413 RepID=A0A9X4IB07_9NEIS|nr:MliC family protein [Neisseria sp. 51.81]MDD9327940.1 MliC family protein [Neisseria sp. 51.81]